VEGDLLKLCLDDEGMKPEDIRRFARSSLERRFATWCQAAAVNPTVPAFDAHAVRRGHDLFVDARSTCTTCHVNYGRDAAWRYDVWGVAVRPANLFEGHHHGGSEPTDLFRRIRCGIVGSNMPAASQLSEPEIWDIVAFLKALPDPRHLPPEVRRVVYPGVQP
jgi:mono/diheme cytochrome c family protein